MQCSKLEFLCNDGACIHGCTWLWQVSQQLSLYWCGLVQGADCWYDPLLVAIADALTPPGCA